MAAREFAEIWGEQMHAARHLRVLAAVLALVIVNLANGARAAGVGAPRPPHMGDAAIQIRIGDSLMTLPQHSADQHLDSALPHNIRPSGVARFSSDAGGGRRPSRSMRRNERLCGSPLPWNIYLLTAILFDFMRFLG